MPAGRPAKYKKKYAKMLIEFFDVEPYIDKELPHYKNGQHVWTDFKRLPNKLPTLHSFATKIGVHRETLLNWANEKIDPDENGSIENRKYPEFFDAYMRAKDMQEEFLIQNGLSGLYPPASYVFTAKNITSMKDKSHIEQSGTIINEHVIRLPAKKSVGELPDIQDAEVVQDSLPSAKEPKPKTVRRG